MKNPDFLGIGCHKGGTTWLYENLRIHPNIWLPPVKELDYFYRLQYGPRDELKALMDGDGIMEREWRSHIINLLGERYRKHPYPEALDWTLKYLFGHLGDEWYRSLFIPAKNRICGEISTSYAIVSDEITNYVHRMLPNIKIIYLLRYPIERAFSQIAMDFCYFGKRDINDIGEKEIFKRLNPDDHIIRNCLYHSNINRWEKYFDKKKIFIGFFEEITEDPIKLLYRIFNFLEVNTPSNYIPPLAHKKINQSVLNNYDKKIFKSVSKKISKLIINDLELLEKKYNGPTTEWLKNVKKIHSE